MLTEAPYHKELGNDGHYVSGGVKICLVAADALEPESDKISGNESKDHREYPLGDGEFLSLYVRGSVVVFLHVFLPEEYPPHHSDKIEDILYYLAVKLVYEGEIKIGYSLHESDVVEADLALGAKHHGDNSGDARDDTDDGIGGDNENDDLQG